MATRSSKRRKLSHDADAPSPATPATPEVQEEPTSLRRSSRRSQPSARAAANATNITPSKTSKTVNTSQEDELQQGHWQPSSPSTPHVLRYEKGSRNLARDSNRDVEPQVPAAANITPQGSARRRGRPGKEAASADVTPSSRTRRTRSDATNAGEDHVTANVKHKSQRSGDNSSAIAANAFRNNIAQEKKTANGPTGRSSSRDALAAPTEDELSFDTPTKTGKLVKYGIQNPVDDPDDKAHHESAGNEDFEPIIVVSSKSSHPVEEDAQTTSPSSSTKLAIGQNLDLLKLVVLEKLTGRRRIPLVGLDEEYAKVDQLVGQTILAGEGNSMLIIGSRGTGKTTMVNEIISEARKNHNEHFHVVRLNGFIHTDDKLAIRDIWRQLGKEMEVEGDDQTKNYGDALLKLLALLSQTSALPGSDSERTAKSIIFIIDEFDLFTTHPRQTLLYNLFDMAQSRKAPLAVLGLTSRVDIAEHLEKRVKSRFSHRYVHLTLSKNFVVFKKTCKTALQVSPEELSFDERARLTPVESKTKKNAPRSKTLIEAENIDVLGVWNSSIEETLNSGPVSKHLERIFYSTKSIPDALASFFIPVSMIDTKTPIFSHTVLTALETLSGPDSKLHLLASLPQLALAMLIAAARLDIILDSDTCNFNMAYEEYCNLAAKARMASSGAAGGTGMGGKVWGRNVAKQAWERLLKLDLIIPVVGSGAAAGPSDMVRCDVALEEIEGSVPDMERGMEKWCREI